MQGKLSKYVLPLLATAMLGFSIFHVVRAQQTPPQPPPPVEPARTPFGSTVAGAGITEPISENISIGSPFPGVVHETVGAACAASGMAPQAASAARAIGVL